MFAASAQVQRSEMELQPAQPTSETAEKIALNLQRQLISKRVMLGMLLLFRIIPLAASGAEQSQNPLVGIQIQMLEVRVLCSHQHA